MEDSWDEARLIAEREAREAAADRQSARTHRTKLGSAARQLSRMAKDTEKSKFFEGSREQQARQALALIEALKEKGDLSSRAAAAQDAFKNAFFVTSEAEPLDRDSIDDILAGRKNSGAFAVQAFHRFEDDELAKDAKRRGGKTNLEKLYDPEGPTADATAAEIERLRQLDATAAETERLRQLEAAGKLNRAWAASKREDRSNESGSTSGPDEEAEERRRAGEGVTPTSGPDGETDGRRRAGEGVTLTAREEADAKGRQEWANLWEGAKRTVNSIPIPDIGDAINPLTYRRANELTRKVMDDPVWKLNVMNYYGLKEGDDPAVIREQIYKLALRDPGIVNRIGKRLDDY